MSFRSLPSSTHRQGRALVERFLALYESEMWPPEGLSGVTRADASARRQLAALYALRTPLWDALPDAGMITIRELMRRTASSAPLEVRHLALRLGRCDGWFVSDKARRHAGRNPLQAEACTGDDRSVGGRGAGRGNGNGPRIVP